MSKHFKSVFNNEQELLKAILSIHNKNKDIELDPMYFKGNFYKDEVNKPKYKYDICPIIDGVEKGDAGFLNMFEGCINSMILDPPF